ncbi:MAG: hypothetical protein M0Q15_15905 [Nevskia sp.]|nr:hypothetical protein [Nevskia sp.]
MSQTQSTPPVDHDDPCSTLLLALLAIMESGQLDQSSDVWRGGVAALDAMGIEIASATADAVDTTGFPL